MRAPLPVSSIRRLPSPRRGGSGRPGARLLDPKREWLTVRLGWGTSIALFLVPLVLVVATVFYHRASATPIVAVTVLDEYTGSPLPAVEVTAGGERFLTDAAGSVDLALRGPLTVRFAADRYAALTSELEPAVGPRLSVTLRPTTLSGRLTDAESGAPVADAAVTAVGDAGLGPSVRSDADGRFFLTDVPEAARLRIEADAYGTVERPIEATTVLDLALKRTLISGVVRDGQGAAIAGAQVVAANGSASTVSGPDGTYRLSGGSEVEEVVVSAPGFADRRLAVPASRDVSVTLEPESIKAVYANLGVLATPERMDRLIEIADTTEINAIVIDVKQDTVYYDTQVPFFRDLEGVVTPIFDPAELLARLDERGIYSIARMVVFKDPVVAERRPDLAVKDEVAGGLWRDMNGSAWVNAFNEELWQANAELGAELARLGFDEVQYDYIRFPSDGDLRTADFGRDYSEANRRAAIAGAVAAGAEAVRGAGAKFAIDLFPIIVLFGDDQGIGQTLQDLAPLADYVNLMIYPSHYEIGNIPVDGHPNDFPAETVTYTLEAAEALVPGSRLKMRPWLQDFTYPLEGYTPYGAAEVRAQIDAAEAFGTSGWMLWNAAGEFEVAALEPEP